MRIGITYGTFDVLHYGHINLIKRAKEYCDFLIVAVSTDEFNQIKGKQSYLSYEERVGLIKSLKYVNLVIPEENWEQKYEDVKKYNIDVLIMGDDWTGKFNDVCKKVVYLPRTEIISSSIIKDKIKEVNYV